MQNIDDLVWTLNYWQIIELPEDLREQVLKEYNEIMKRISDDVYSEYKTLEEMAFEMDSYTFSQQGEYLFPGREVKFYPIFHFGNCGKEFTCAISSSHVPVGDAIVTYKGFIYLPKEKEAYVSKSIKALDYYRDTFPTDFKGFENFCYMLDTSYSRNDSYFYDIDTNIHGMTLRKLEKKRKKVRNCK